MAKPSSPYLSRRTWWDTNWANFPQPAALEVTPVTVRNNCYLDWNPTDIKQLEGRIWRFGNIFSHVRIVVPLIENSFDIFLNQKLGEKTSRVNHIWSKNGRKTVLKLEELNPDELKKGLITDPEELVKMEVEEQTQELSIQRDLLRGYVKQLGEAASEKAEVDRLDRKLRLTAERANEKWAYSASTDPKTIARIVKMPISDIKSIYRKVKAYAETREWSEKYDLKRAVDEHIKKLKKLGRTERGILSKNDLSINDDFQQLIAKYERKISKISLEIKVIQSESNKQALLQEFIEEKEKKNLESKPLKERVQEFERLNYLLECSKVPLNNGNTCTIYGINRGEGEQKIVKYEKADWEINQSEFIKRRQSELPKNRQADIEELKQNHQLAVAKAIERGEQIPREVLEEYPELKSKISVPTFSEQPYKMSAKLKAFIPKHQQKVIRSWNEDLKKDVLAPLDKQIQAIPKRQSSGIDELIVYAHFFYAGSDWFITDWNGKNELFGYTILNGDVQMSELGGLWLSDLVNDGRVELDFHWTPKYLAEALFESGSAYFPKPKKRLKAEIEKGNEQPVIGIKIQPKVSQANEVKLKKLKLAKAKAIAQKQRIRILELENSKLLPLP